MKLAGFAFVASIVGLGCGGAEAPAAVITASSARPAPPLAAPPAVTAPRTARAAPPDVGTIFARLKPGLVACYEKGKAATPTMLDAQLTLNVSIDASGKATCVIPTQDKGLTQEVEDCMSARLASEKFDEGTPWTAAIPISVRAGVVQPGERARDVAGIDSVETFRMADAFEVLESLEPDLARCVSGVEKSAGLRFCAVGARVGLDGRVLCALASTAGTLPPKVGDCAAGVLRAAKFPPPKGGPGLVIVPITIGN